MTKKPIILGINGSASPNSSNLAILKLIAELGKSNFDLKLVEDLSDLPHFRTELTDQNVPEKIIDFRKQLNQSDAVIICTPEYVFSIPSGLKNLLEWCVSTTVFSNKPLAIITAAANGEKGHEELKLIMKTIQANFTDETSLLIQGIKGKMDASGVLMDGKTRNELEKLVHSFEKLLNSDPNS